MRMERVSRAAETGPASSSSSFQALFVRRRGALTGLQETRRLSVSSVEALSARRLKRSDVERLLFNLTTRGLVAGRRLQATQPSQECHC